jgi:hypothetical protein
MAARFLPICPDSPLQLEWEFDSRSWEIVTSSLRGFSIDPFLLPTCSACSGPMSLSYLEPASEYQPERRTYRCADCGAEETVRAAPE